MRVILTILLLAICCTALAQKDKVYLKNGSLIKGEIADNILIDSVTVLIGDIPLKIPLSYVSELVYAKRADGKRPEGYKNYTYARGSFFNISSGLVVGDHSNNNTTEARPYFELAWEYHHSPWLNLAVGGGFNVYEHYNMSPIFLQYQYVFGEKDRAVFLYARGGKGFLVKNKLDEDFFDIYPGFCGGIGAGWQRKVGNNFIRLQAGYQFQKVEEEQHIFNSWMPIPGPRTPVARNYIVRERTLNRTVIGFSFVF